MCHLKQIEHQDPRMSRMHHIRTSCKYWMVLTWDILFESADQEIFFFSPLFLSQACTFWLKAHKIAKQMHCVYYLPLPPLFLFLSISIQYLNFVLIIHDLSVLILLPHKELKLSHRYIPHLCFSLNAVKKIVNSKCGILLCWILLLILDGCSDIQWNH